MNPQTTREGQRILAVVDELLEDLAILSLVPPYMGSLPHQDQNHIANSFSGNNGGREAIDQLNEHFVLEKKLEGAAGDLSPDDVLDHHMSTRALVDTLRRAEYPHYEAVYPANKDTDNFAEPVMLLRGLLKDRFSTTVEEDAVKFNILRDTVNRENTATADVQALNREYANEVESRRVEVKKRETMIAKLKDEIDALQMSSKSEISTFVQLSEEHRQNDEERFENDDLSLAQKVKDSEVDMGNTSNRCIADEKQMRGARSKKESTLQKMIEDYDTEMISASEAMKRLGEETSTDKENLGGLEKELAQYRAEEEDHELQEAAEKLRLTHRAMIEGDMVEQAKIIQAYFRSHAARLHEAQKGKKKKKGKGKKK